MSPIALARFLALVLLVALLSTGCAQLRPLNLDRAPANFAMAPGYPVQSVTLEQFKGCEAAQAETVWCWAACAAMVRNYEEGERGQSPKDQATARREQSDIVDRIRGRDKEDRNGEDEEAAAESEVLGALNLDAYDRLVAREKEVESHVIDVLINHREELDKVPQELIDAEPKAPPLGFDPARLVYELEHDHPLIAGLHLADGTGHVVVVFGARYQAVPVGGERPAIGGEGTPAPDFEYRIMEVQTWDPTSNEGVTEKFGGEHWQRGKEFADLCVFLASQGVAEEYLAFLQLHNDWADAVYGGKHASP